ncbi:MAG: LamG domain-containing protein [Armatimonadota bacterium]
MKRATLQQGLLLAVISLLFVLSAPRVTAANVIGQWNFDEGSGTTAIDSSGNGCNGTISGSPTWATGPYGTCLYFDGVNDYVRVPDGVYNKAAPFTIACWYRPEVGITPPTQHAVFDHKFDAFVDRYWMEEANCAFSCYDDARVGRTVANSYTLPPQTWVFVAVTVTPTTVKLYKNGVLIRTTTISGFGKYVCDLGIGAMLYNNPHAFFKGWIDNFTMYDDALNDTDILNQYTSQAAVYAEQRGDQRIIGQWKFDEGTGNTVADASGNGCTGTIYGTPTWATGKAGNCLYLDGATNWVDIPYGAWAESTPLTFSFWYKCISGQSNQTVLDHAFGNAYPGEYYYQADNGDFCGYDGTPTGFHCSDASKVLDNWTFVTVTVTNSQIREYYDGRLAHTTTIANGIPKINGLLRLGKWAVRSGGNGGYFHGWLDEVTIRNYAMSGTDIEDLYESYIKDPTVIGYWQFDENTGTSVCDWSGNHTTMDLVGATWNAAGRIGTCAYFNGTSAMAELPGGAYNIASPWSLTVWVKLDASFSGTGTILVHAFDAFAGAYQVYYYAGHLVFTGYDGSKTSRTINGAITLTPGTWYLVGVTTSSTLASLYVNGSLLGSTAITSGWGLRLGTTTLGYQADNRTNYFKGYLDELVYYNADKSASMATIYNNYVTNNQGPGTPYSGVAVGAVFADKMVYAAGGSATANIILRNFGASSKTFTLNLDTYSWLATTRNVYSQSKTLAAGACLVQPVTFTLGAGGGESLGVGLRATTTGSGAYAEAPVAVTSKFWQAGICGKLAPSGCSSYDAFRNGRNTRALRRQYANWLEWFFWAPDDWGNLNPAPSTWYSGQAAYYQVKANLQDLISQAHANGLKMITYGKSTAGGPDGWETCRQHPEWFYKSALTQPIGSYDVYSLDNWNNKPLRDGGWAPPSSWYWLFPDMRQQTPLDYGISQLTQSIGNYAWDGVRFDGHYTTWNDELSTWNMQRLKTTVWGSYPNLPLGFNYGYSPANYLTGMNHEMREAMAGGGMWMQEAINNFNYTETKAYTSWNAYATNETAVCKQIQSYGGSYHCIWNLDSTPKSQYKLIYGLAAGGHPVYGTHVNVPGCPNWGKFMTRWASFLWQPHLTQVANPAAQVTVSNEAYFTWQPLMQEFIASTTKKFKVVHLVNKSLNDAIASTSLPPARTSVTVTLTADAGTTVTNALVIRPESDPFGKVLYPTKVVGNTYQVTVDTVNLWAIVVFEESGAFTVPTDPPSYTEAPNETEVDNARGLPSIPYTDPWTPAANISLAPNQILWETDKGYNSVPAIGKLDPDANNGIAQCRDVGVTSMYAGRTWMGPLQPGRYTMTVRVKLVDTVAPIDRQYINWYTYKYYNPGAVFQGTTLAAYDTDPTRVPPERLMTVDGQYHDYTLPEMQYTEYGWTHLIGGPAVIGDTNNQCFVDHVIITQLQRYTDVDLEASHTANKPGGLRTPNGANPASVLEVYGMHWQKYNCAAAITGLVGTYTMPADYASLYAYDAVILNDIDFTNTSWATRRMFSDYVNDGGRLIILGGPFSLGVGSYQSTYLEDMLPFTLTGVNEVVPCEPALLLGPTPGTPYADNPNLLWRHNVAVKTGVTTLAYADTLPIAAYKLVGGNGGRVAAFAGTVQGIPALGASAFWQCASWTTLLQQLVLQ